jgi:hypothetical protein
VGFFVGIWWVKEMVEKMVEWENGIKKGKRRGIIEESLRMVCLLWFNTYND